MANSWLSDAEDFIRNLPGTKEEVDDLIRAVPGTKEDAISFLKDEFVGLITGSASHSAVVGSTMQVIDDGVERAEKCTKSSTCQALLRFLSGGSGGMFGMSVSDRSPAIDVCRLFANLPFINDSDFNFSGLNFNAIPNNMLESLTDKSNLLNQPTSAGRAAFSFLNECKLDKLDLITIAHIKGIMVCINSYSRDNQAAYSYYAPLLNQLKMASGGTGELARIMLSGWSTII
jgi:hypothetical protein